MTGPAIPKSRSYLLADVRLIASLLTADFRPADAEGFARCDIVVADGRIAEIAHSGSDLGIDLPRVALGGDIVLPCFTDVHTHLDKGHIWPRAHNADGTFASALTTVEADRLKNWSADDVAARMDFSLRCAYAHGTRAIRSHVDSVGPQTRLSWPVVSRMREKWRGRIDLQAAPLYGVDWVANADHMVDVEAMVTAHGSGILGAVTYMIPNLQDALNTLFAVAARKGWDLDFHVDETEDPAAVSLGVVAQTAIDHRFAGKILVGHCCSLSRQDEPGFQRSIDLVARAGLNVVSLPMCNMYLQDRHGGRTPRWRGITALHELKSAGVPVMIASDNTRDPFFPFGDLDMLEVWREGVRILHMDHPVSAWTAAIFETPWRVMGLGTRPFAKGAPADLIVTSARSYTELFSRPQADRIVLRAGQAIDQTLPSYRELDGLEGLRP